MQGGGSEHCQHRHSFQTREATRLILAVSYAQPLADDILQSPASHSHPQWVALSKPCRAPLYLSSPPSLLPPLGVLTCPLLSVPVLLLRCAYIINLGLTPSLPPHSDGTDSGSRGSTPQPLLSPTSPHGAPQIPFQALSPPSSFTPLTSPPPRLLFSQSPILSPSPPVLQTQVLLCSLTPWSLCLNLCRHWGLTSPFPDSPASGADCTGQWAMGRARHLAGSLTFLTTDS